MTQEHPITPPPDLLKHWEDQHFDEGENYDVMLVQAYQAGADHELEACCQEVQDWYGNGSRLRAIRRSKPPSLKEQALAALDEAVIRGDCITVSDALPAIRRAIASLPS